MHILEKIVVKKREQLIKEKQLISLNEMKEKASALKSNEDKVFMNSLVYHDGLSIIAEIKKASPSRGIIREDFNHVKIAIDYELNKADAISCLTEKHFFMGSSDYLEDIKKVTSLPVLRKDFIIDEYQLYESKVIGADAHLLIVAILTDSELTEYLKLSEQLNIDCLVEVHDREELKRAVDAGAKIIGINNRNLKTFEVSLKTTEELVKFIPDGIVKVSESGILYSDAFYYMRDLDIDAVLIGEAFMKSQNIVQVFKEFRNG
ncbi:MAG: indole-3-glycerol phosphate synthase TrpC [Clostridia bacterium]|nr:indole-3-glycerol phosphate synthase TrpC [Clostridia bacterium]